MITDNIAALYNINFQPAQAANVVPANASNVFGDIYDTALGALGRTNAYLNTANKAQLDFAAGKTDDILAVILAQEKAYSSLNFTVQVTNRVIEAYREIMRMQI